MHDQKVAGKKRNALSLVLYVFAGLAVVLGALFLIGLIGSAQAVPTYDLFFQLAGIEELAGMVLRPLQAVLVNAGILVFVLMLAIAALLFVAARLVARQAGLVEQVRVLEERMVRLEGRN